MFIPVAPIIPTARIPTPIIPTTQNPDNQERTYQYNILLKNIDKSFLPLYFHMYMQIRLNLTNYICINYIYIYYIYIIKNEK